VRKVFLTGAVTLLLVSCSGPAPEMPTPIPQTAAPTREPLVHVVIPEKLEAGAGAFKADWSFDLVAAQEWSAHVHVIPQDQVVPPHRHPDNDELSFVASGAGEWGSWTATDAQAFELGIGQAAVAPAGAVHSMRNRHPEPLAVVVLHRPEFGQNWFVMPDEVTGDLRSPPWEEGPPAVFEGWTLSWSDPGEFEAAAADTLYLVAEGDGSLTFEDKTLPLAPGTFVKVPPGLDHAVSGTLRVVRVVIPR